MTGEGHLIFSVACIIFAKKVGLTTVLMHGDWWHIIPAALLTSLLPDIDHPRSLLGQRLKWVSKPIARAFGHRGFTHSFLAIIGGVLLFHLQLSHIWFFPNDVLHAMVIGYFSHLLADMLTPAGIPLFWPYRKRFSIPILNAKKNNQLERVFCSLLVFFSLYWQSDILSMVQPYIEKFKNITI